MGAGAGEAGHAVVGSRRSVAAFGSRPFNERRAIEAIDSIVDGLRTLGAYAPGQTVESSDFASMVGAAQSGMPRYVARTRRSTYDALFVAVGARCRTFLERLHRPAAMAHVTDPVVAQALGGAAVAASRGAASTLLRMAVAAELSGGAEAAYAGNPLRGVIDLYAMGAVITAAPGEALRLTREHGDTTPLAWTGGFLSRAGSGRLRPAAAVDLAF